MERSEEYSIVVEASDKIRQLLGGQAPLPAVGIVCGSGLGGIANALSDSLTIAYCDLGLPQPSTAGHAGRFVFGRLAKRSVVVLQGRAHQHGGFAPWQCTLNIRILARLGVKTLVVTNAAGGLNADYRVGDIMIIRDHIDLPGIGGRSALIGADERFGERFLSMANAYDVALRRKAMRIAVDERIGGVREGVYAVTCGPSYETPAEARALRMLGADAGGMSTAAEVAVARQSGIKVLGLSLITNREKQDDALETLEDVNGEANHEEVLAAGEKRAGDVAKLVEKFIECIEQ